jgi:cytochrome c-type biogenesis protein
MLVVGFKASTHNAAYGVALLLAFAAGHCAVIVAAGTCTALVQKYLNWNEKSRGAILLKRICGGLVLAGGLYLVYIAW